MSEIIENLLTSAVTLTAGLLSAIALRAWLHQRDRRTEYLFFAFFTFFAKGVLLSTSLFLTPDWAAAVAPWSLAFDLMALTWFYLAIIHRGRR